MLFVSIVQIQIFLDQKSMSSRFSLLNSTSNNSKSEEFSLKDIELFVDSKKQPWFHQAHTKQYLGIAYIITSTTKLPEEDLKSRALL